MLLTQVIPVLEQKCQGPAAGPVEVDMPVLKAALDGLKNNQALQKQIDQLQEQMSMKPSVARKLADRIKQLEDELEVTRDASRVKELERKVQKLELDLKQSYSTKNFTLKQGLLDLEKKYRTHIYGNTDLEDLWHEVMLLLVEEKDKEKEAAAATVRRAATLRRPALGLQRVSVTPGNDGPTSLGDGGDGGPRSATKGPPPGEALPETVPGVQQTVEKLQEAYGRDAPPMALHFPTPAVGNGGTPRGAGGHRRNLSTMDSGAPPEAPQQPAWSDSAAQTTEALQTSLNSLRSMFSGKSGGPIFPEDRVASHASAPAAAPRSSGDGEKLPPGAKDDMLALQGSVDELMALWSRLTAAGPPGASHGPGGSRFSGGAAAGSADAAGLDAQVEAVLASITAMKEKYGAEAGGAHSAAILQQADAMAASVSRLRSLYGSSGAPHAPHSATRQAYHWHGHAASAGVGSISVRARDIGVAHVDGAGGLPTQDIIRHFMSFMTAQGLITAPGRAAEASAAQGAGATTTASNADPIGAAALPPVADIIGAFSQYLSEAGLPGAAASVLGTVGSVVKGAQPAAGEGAASSEHRALAGPADMPDWMPLLPALRLSTAAVASGVPGAPVAALLDSAVPEGAPSWWAESLTAAGVDSAAQPPRSASPGPRSPRPRAASTPVSVPATQPAPAAASAATSPEAQLATAGATTSIAPAAHATPERAGDHTGGTTTVPATPHTPSSATVATPFNPLLLPGPARTMQAVMAHVRSKHTALLVSVPQAEALLAEALAAASELQAAQDRSLLRAAIRGKREVRSKRGTHTPRTGTPGLSPTASTNALGPSGLGRASLTQGATTTTTPGTPSRTGSTALAAVQTPARQAEDSLGGAAPLPLTPSGEPPALGGPLFAPSFAFPDVSPATPSFGSPAASTPGAVVVQHAEISPAEPAPSARAAAEAEREGEAEHAQVRSLRPTVTDLAVEVGPSPEEAAEGQDEEEAEDDQEGDDELHGLTLEDYATELMEVRAIAAKHAEHAAALQELLSRLANQHAEALDRADDLDMQLNVATKESSLLREEVESLTRLLVDVKLAYAERDEEAQRLAQRLKRALAQEKLAMDELEELKRRLAVVSEDIVTMDGDYAPAMQAALRQLSGRLVVPGGSGRLSGSADTAFGLPGGVGHLGLDAEPSPTAASLGSRALTPTGLTPQVSYTPGRAGQGSGGGAVGVGAAPLHSAAASQEVHERSEARSFPLVTHDDDGSES